jgi:hypothetical protein
VKSDGYVLSTHLTTAAIFIIIIIIIIIILSPPSLLQQASLHQLSISFPLNQWFTPGVRIPTGVRGDILEGKRKHFTG